MRIKNQSLPALYFLLTSMSFSTCLNAQNTFEIISIGESEFEVSTTISNHIYENASISITPPNVTFSDTSNYKKSPDGGYLFRVSEQDKTTFSFTDYNGLISMKLCLNGLSSIGISCERFTKTVTNKKVAVGQVTSNTLNTPIPFAYTSDSTGKSWSDPIFLSTLLDGELISDVNLPAVSCSSDGLRCVTGGFFLQDPADTNATTPVIYTSTNGGTSFSSPIPLQLVDAKPTPILTQVSGLSCDKDGIRCIAIGQTTLQVSENVQNTRAISYLSVDGGNTWTAPQLLHKPESYFTNVAFNLDCDESNLNCTSAGYGQINVNEWLPLVYQTKDGGKTWGEPTTPPPPSDSKDNRLNGIICSATGNICLTVGSGSSRDVESLFVPYSYTSVNAGATWSGPTLMSTDENADRATNSFLNAVGGSH